MKLDSLTSGRVDALTASEVATFAGMKLVSREDAVRNVLRSFNLDAGETGMFLRQ
jgi:hypothetical protein